MVNNHLCVLWQKAFMSQMVTEFVDDLFLYHSFHFRTRSRLEGLLDYLLHQIFPIIYQKEPNLLTLFGINSIFFVKLLPFVNWLCQTFSPLSKYWTFLCFTSMKKVRFWIFLLQLLIFLSLTWKIFRQHWMLSYEYSLVTIF